VVDLYPHIEPYDEGMLDVGEGNLVYWETCVTSTPIATGSFCSISVAAGGARRMRATRAPTWA
jgi:hypothetical protein